MRFKSIFLLFLPLVLILTPEAMAQKKKSRIDRKIIGAELEFGRQAAKFGLWNEAIFRWERVVKGDPENSDALNNLAVAYESVGNYDKAGKLYEQALALDEDSADIRKNMKRFRSFYRKHRRQLERDQKIKAKNRKNAGDKDDARDKDKVKPKKAKQKEGDA